MSLKLRFLTPRRIRQGCIVLLVSTLLLCFVDFDVEEDSVSEAKAPNRERRIVEQWQLGDDEQMYDEGVLSPPSYLERTRVKLDNITTIPLTRVQRHVPGWTILDNVFINKGTFFLISNWSTSKPLPAARNVLSSGKDIHNDFRDELRREPTDRHMQVIDPSQVMSRLGTLAKRIEGTSFVVTESPQYFSRKYNLAAEIFFGLWRTYASLDPSITPIGETDLPIPQRVLLPNIIDFHRRDKEGFTSSILGTAFPSTTVDAAEAWQDLIDVGQTFLCDRIVVADRAAAMRTDDWHTEKHFAAFTRHFVSSPYWWVPIRNTFHERSNVFVTADELMNSRPQITYLIGSKRAGHELDPHDHEELVRELQRLKGSYGYDVEIQNIDTLSIEDQVRVAARSTIVIGTRGEALIPLLWMVPTPRSAIIEFATDLEKVPNYAFNGAIIGIASYAFYGTA